MTSLAALLHEHFDPTFPVSVGNGKKDDPLVIIEPNDYVGVEHAAVRHIFAMLREEYALSEQRLHSSELSVIDELVFDVKDLGDSEWTGIRRFFFDITLGYHKSAG